jgi:hypothetical protein
LELYNNPNELKNLYCSLLYKKINTGDMIVVDKSIYEPGIDGFIDIQTIKIDQKKFCILQFLMNLLLLINNKKN